MEEQGKQVCGHPNLVPMQWNQARPEPCEMVKGCECGANASCPVCGYGHGAMPCACRPASPMSLVTNKSPADKGSWTLSLTDQINAVYDEEMKREDEEFVKQVKGYYRRRFADFEPEEREFPELTKAHFSHLDSHQEGSGGEAEDLR